MTTKNLILGSLSPVINASRYVRTEHDKIADLAQKIKDYPLPGWDNTLQFLGDDKETAQYYFFLDSTNFCFWAEKGKEKWSFRKDDEWLTGYYAYACALKCAMERNHLLFEADYITRLSFEEFARIFEGKGELLLLKERHEIIVENFGILKQRFQGEAANLVQAAQHDANSLVSIILENFPTFHDWVVKENKKIYFLKRAQIFISDLYYAFQGKHLGQFNNLQDLAIFADYKLPQLLEAEKVLVYNRELLTKIKNERLMSAGSQEELEIRAHTIYASELLRQELEKLGRSLTSNELDWLLWVLAKQSTFTLPHHKTLTTYY